MSKDAEEAPEQHPGVPNEVSASAPGKQRNLIPWQPGQSGNPKGRAKGSRNKLAEDFLRDLHVVWGEHGVTALKAAAQEKPLEFCKMVAGLLPKEDAVKNELSEYTDEELAALAVLTEAILRDAENAEQAERGGAGTKTVN